MKAGRTDWRDGSKKHETVVGRLVRGCHGLCAVELSIGRFCKATWIAAKLKKRTDCMKYYAGAVDMDSTVSTTWASRVRGGG